MPLPINIEDLIQGRAIEWERLEFKAGWNPKAVMHTACAFANDVNNWGGGYIIVGIEEDQGRPVLPPKGLDHLNLDRIQKELIQVSQKITPTYLPVSCPIKFKGKWILVLWCPGGDTRPYKAAISMAERSSGKAYFVRRGSVTAKASVAEEQLVLSLAAKVPFDDRINHHAEIEDLNPHLIKRFLQEVGSDLAGSVDRIELSELARQMQIARGPDEYLKPVNVGLLMFNEDPARFFPGAKIEIVEFHDSAGDRFTETVFSGPIHEQLRDALRFLRNNLIQERVEKRPDRAEADRYHNYPYLAIEEALANAVYHRSYEHRGTIEVSIRDNAVNILSFPGPLPPVTPEDLKKERVISRDYRNRRIGDFLKEMHLTEGRNTGFPKIARALKQNGSPPAEYITDSERLSFLAVIRCHPAFSAETSQTPPQNGLVDGLVDGLVETQQKILQLLSANPTIPKREMARRIGVSTTAIDKNIEALKKKHIIRRVGPARGGHWEILRGNQP